MPDYYTHPNGCTVKRDDGGVRLVITTNTGYTSTWIDNPKVDALRDFFLRELGLWRDPETGALVVVDSWDEDRQSVSIVRAGRAWDARRLRSMPDWEREILGDVATELDGIIARWRATLTPPPREPKPGEVWRITFPEGQERNALVSCVDGMTAFRWGGDWHPVDEWPADRRRLLVEADGTVVSDE